MDEQTWKCSTLGNSRKLKAQAGTRPLTPFQLRFSLLDLSKHHPFTELCILSVALHWLFVKEVCMSWKGVIGIVACVLYTVQFQRFHSWCRQTAKHFETPVISKDFSTGHKALVQRRLSNSSLPHGLRFTVCNTFHTFQCGFCCIL